MVQFIAGGYRLLDVPNPFGGPVYHAFSTGSTMEDAARLLKGDRGDGATGRAGSPSEEAPVPGTVLSAGFQNRGIGRIAGRVWHSPPGESLLFSLLLAEKAVRFPVTLLPLAAAAGLARFAREDLGLSPRIKWPNDLLISGRKCAGILCRKSRGWLVTGIGLNVSQRSFPNIAAAAAEGGPTSLALEHGGKVRAPLELLPIILDRLKESFETERIAEEAEDLLWRRGEEYSVSLGDPESGESVTGTAEGIGADGSLLLRVGSKLVPVFSGEAVL